MINEEPASDLISTKEEETNELLADETESDAISLEESNNLDYTFIIDVSGAHKFFNENEMQINWKEFEDWANTV